MPERFSLKDHLFNRETVAGLAAEVAAGLAGFDAAAFTEKVLGRLPGLELKARIDWIADCLEPHLAGDFAAMADRIELCLPPPLDPAKTDDDFGHFIHAPWGVLVARHGLAQPERALACLAEITQRFSMEFALRPFLDAHTDLALGVLTGWCGHPSPHVRRLVSEGTRPQLPWAGRLGIDWRLALPLLDRLHADPARYVTRSVANHLGDIAKRDLPLAIARLADWRGQRRAAREELAWIERHALRLPLKAGAPEAMVFLGYRPDAPVTVSGLTLSPDLVARGDRMNLSFTLTASQPVPVVVDYVIDFLKANGRTSPKTFKLKTAELVPGKPQRFSKRHRFKDGATTFTLYPGRHRLGVQVNGRRLAEADFDLA